MKITFNVKFAIGDTVYHVVDKDAQPFTIVGYVVEYPDFDCEPFIFYRCALVTGIDLFRAMELTKEKPLECIM